MAGIRMMRLVMVILLPGNLQNRHAIIVGTFAVIPALREGAVLARI